MASGLFEADLGGGLIKKRVPFKGKGKRGSARTIVATRFLGRWIFLFGFAKNERGNIDRDELVFLHKAAAELLALDEHGLQELLVAGSIVEICDGEAKEQDN